MAEKEYKNAKRRIIKKNSSLGKRITINISGLRYETYDKTLERFPDSLLGSKDRRDDFYDSVNNEYFFDRNRTCFESILAYYQTCGVLIRPPNIPRKVFVSDIKYFDLGDQALMQAGDELEATTSEIRLMPKNKLQRKIWSLFEHPDTSNFARAIAIFSVVVIVLSIVLFCVETLPQFQHKPLKILNINGTEEIANRNPNKSIFFGIESFCIAWFTIEYVLRLLCSPNKCKFIVSVLNIIDLVAILPFFITLPMKEPTSVSSLAILRCVRLVRVFRIFKLSRYSRGLQILGHTLKASLRELGLLLFFLCVGVILFSSAVYYAEFNSSKDNEFLSIPHSFWWSIITMTTVGYGDMVPKTLGGKLVGCFCAISGVLAIALPVPVIVSNFAYYYSREHSKGGGQEEEEEEEEEEGDEAAKEEKYTGMSTTCTTTASTKPRRCCGRPRLLLRKRKKKKYYDSDIHLPEIKVQDDAAMDCQNGNHVQTKELHKMTSSNGETIGNATLSNELEHKGDGVLHVTVSEDSSSDGEDSETEPFLNQGTGPAGETNLAENKLFMANAQALEMKAVGKKEAVLRGDLDEAKDESIL